MKSINVVAVAIFVALLSLNSASAVDSAARKTSVISSLSSMSLAFTENQGQWPDSILFRANAGGATMWFTKNGAYYQFTRRIPNNCERQMSTSAPFSDHQPDHIETMMIKADFVGSNPTPRVVGEGLLDYKCNYFLGNDPAKWRTDVPNYSAIVYQDIYPGIDLKYYGSGKQMEYDFIVSPGADFSQIRIQYEGVKSLSVDGAGCLVVETEWGTVTELRPLVYQLERGERLLTAGEYTLLGENRFGFRLKGGYNPALTLVIDPILSYSTYLGGESDDEGHGIAVDNSGNAYVTGRTLSTNFPTQNAYQTDQPGWDVFVTKFSATGDSLIYSTYLGGNGANGDCGYGIAVDDTGNAYVTGYTYSANFPTTPDAYDNSKNGLNDVFVTKLSPSGNLVYSTYLGGAGSDDGYGIAVDDSGNAYVTGWTHSSNFPTTDCAYDTIFNGSDVFVTKFSATGDSLVYSTFLGKWGGEMGYGIAVDTSGNAYVTGHT
ncbi:MAG: SBBP repeat-containing protein, partial [Candidatus Zixiibacteriota bacterium]